MNRQQRRNIERMWRSGNGPPWTSAHPSYRTDYCEGCGADLVQGQPARLLLDELGGHIYGHVACVDEVVARRVRQGDKYLGDHDAST